MRIAVLASGGGSILQALLDDGIPVTLVVTDRACGASDIAGSAAVDSVCVERTTYDNSFDRVAYSRRLVEVLDEAGVELVVMAGFGTILAQPVFDAYPDAVVNTHPALLPSFPGWHGVRDALAHGVKVTGCTVHVATLEVDAGPILAQEAIAVLPDDTEATLHERIKVVERRIFAQTIRDIIERGSVL